MSDPNCWLEIPDDLARILDEYPRGYRERKLEKAINDALDAAGSTMPRADRPPAPEQWWVNIWNRDGSLRGHVGPIPHEVRAETVASSWRKSGVTARPSGTKLGVCLTAQFTLIDGLRS